MNPYAILGIVAAWLLSLAAMGYWQNDAGRTSEKVKWQATQTRELADANKKIVRLNDEARAIEQQRAALMSRIADGYEKERSNEKRKTDAVIADLRSGLLGLYDHAAGIQAGADQTGATGPGTGGSDGGAGTQLSRTAAEFLYTEADRADAIVRQLTACQQVVMDDRITVNGVPR